MRHKFTTQLPDRETVRARFSTGLSSLLDDTLSKISQKWFGYRLVPEKVSQQRLQLENLERRELLAADLTINEFLARNDGGLRDGDGRSSDWIELENRGDANANLNGYRLTDDHTELSKWVFPNIDLGAGDRLVIFASGQAQPDYVDSDGNLHTNFTLRRSGEYLALVSPANEIVSEFGTQDTTFPEQVANVSYGGAQSLTLLTPDDEISYRVPTDSSVDGQWTAIDFDATDHGFVTGKASIGYEDRPNNRTNFTGAFETELPSASQGVYTRMEFQLNDPSAITALQLTMQYDNGFIAYLNGTRVASAHAPENGQWLSLATDSSRRDSVALEPAEFDLKEGISALVSGKNVLAIHGLNNFSDPDFLLVPTLQAGASDLQAVSGEPTKIGYMPTPTPAEVNVGNDEVFSGFVEDTTFSVDRGYYNEPFQVEISVDTEGAQIYYSTDGSIPTPETGTAYSGSITVDTTTTLRAAAHKDDFMPSNTDTQTYIFPEHVFRQDGAGLEGGGRWGHRGPDWEMDQDVVNHPDPENRPTVGDLLSLRTVSLVLDWDEMFGGSGIYVRGQGVEIATSVELMSADGSEGFQKDASVQIVGGSSASDRWKTDKLSMRLKFNREFGSSDLEFPVFGEDAAQSFDTLVLDAHLNNVWHYNNTTEQRNYTQYLRDMFAADMQNALGGTATHDEHMFLFINGVLHGMHRVHERPDDNFAASYLGGENEDYDILKHTASTVLSGTRDNFRELFNRAGEDMTVPENYQAVVDMLDVDDFINYMLVNYYGGNADWDHHNWYASFNRVDPEGRWRFHSWDAEKILQQVRDDETRTRNNRAPTGLFHSLIKNPEFKLRFADLVQKHMHNDGVLTPETISDLYQFRLDQIDGAVRVESARWGDVARPGNAYTRTDWMRERDRILNEYFPQRTDAVLSQFERQNFLPDVNPAQFNQHGGVVSSTFDLELNSAEGTVYYTTDGSDPRVTGGAIADKAIIYSGSLNLADNTTIKARVLHNGEWSALTEASFLIASEVPIRITELNFNPHDANSVTGAQEVEGGNDRFEYIELVNVSNQPVNLQGVQLARSGDEEGISFTFGANQLAAGEQIVVVRDAEAFQSRYGSSVRIATGNDGDGGNNGEYAGRLSNNGEQLTLLDATGQAIQQFSYKTTKDWPARARGAGSSLEIVDPLGSYSNSANWRNSSEFGGSPGAPGSDPSSGGIVISEILANTRAPAVDMIELRNTSGHDIDVANWFISDSPDDYFKGKIASPMTIPALGYAVVSQNDIGLDINGFSGGELLLTSADANGKPLRFENRVEFGIAGNGVSMGPFPSSSDTFVPLNTTTFGGPNSGPQVGDVIISEIYADPHDPDGAGRTNARDLEFVEIHNTTDNAIDLTGWQLAGQIAFAFPDSTMLGGHESLVMVSFNHTDTGKAATFKFSLGMALGDPLFSRLSNPDSRRDIVEDDGALVQLLRPGLPPVDDPSAIPMLAVDEVDYRATSPWPTDTSGTGKSLNRVRPEDYGPFATSWVSAAATPGAVEFFQRIPGDANNDGQFDQLDIALVLQGNKFNTGEQASWSEGDWNGDGLFNQLDLVASLQAGRYLQGPQAARDLVFAGRE